MKKKHEIIARNLHELREKEWEITLIFSFKNFSQKNIAKPKMEYLTPLKTPIRQSTQC